MKEKSKIEKDAATSKKTKGTKCWNKTKGGTKWLNNFIVQKTCKKC